MSATLGLSPNDVVNVQLILEPKPAQTRNFGVLLIAGSSPIIDPVERIRPYVNLTAVANDFGTNREEYLAADLAFSQVPQIALLYIGRWVATPSSASLHGAALSAMQQLMTTWQAIANGTLAITIDGNAKTLTAMDFTRSANLNSVAGILTAALGGAATVVWKAAYGRFDVYSNSTGTVSAVSYATPAGSGTDVSAALGLTAASGASAPVQGQLAETPLAAASVFVSKSNGWYGLEFADTTVTDAQHIAVAAFVEGCSPSRVYGYTSSEPAVLDPTQASDIASSMQSLGYNRTVGQWSSSSPYSISSFLARAFSVDFTGSNTTLTMKFQTEPGVAAEYLNEVQAATAKAKAINTYVNYSDGVAFVQEGVMASGQFFDVIFGTDWLQNAAQVALFNVLLTAGTKVPQTDPGVHQLVTALTATMFQAVNNGLLAPGVWTGPSFGQIVQGQYLTNGFYIYAPSVDGQTLAARAGRVAPLIQVAAKGAGAIHFANVTISYVN